MKPLLSICIPTYNRSQLLERMLICLELALANIPKDCYEVVFRDNNSTDNTKNVVFNFSLNHPTKYSKNSENIGVTRNLFLSPLEASGEYIWFLGDDDLIVSDAIQVIISHLEKYNSFDGHIVSHAICLEEERVYREQNILSGIPQDFPLALIVKGTRKDYLSRFEEVFRYTEISGALNFLSNVLFRKSSWDSSLNKYQQHCLGIDEFSDTITSAGYMCLWCEFLVGKPVGLIPNPLIIGFVGQQSFLAKWPTLLIVFFLDVSNFMIRFGANPRDILLYKRQIYLQPSLIASLTDSKQDFAEKHFSLFRLIRDYGSDHLLNLVFLKALFLASSYFSKLRLCFFLLLGFIFHPMSFFLTLNHILCSVLKRLIAQAKRILYFLAVKF